MFVARPLWPGLPNSVAPITILSNQVNRQRSRQHLLSALPAVNLYLLALPVGGALPRDTSHVRHLRLIPRRLEGASDHADCLTEIGAQAHPIKQAEIGRAHV